MSKELDDRLEQWLKWTILNRQEKQLLNESIAALRSEPVAWIPVGERLLEDVDGEVLSVTMNGYVQIITASTLRSIKRAADKCGKECNITHWMPLPAAPSRETDQRENSNPAPMHGQSKTGLTGSHPGAPTQAEPALSVEPPKLDGETIEVTRTELLAYTHFSPERINRLCDMALSSLTARDEVEKMRRRVEIYRDKARGNHEAYLKLYADFVGIEGVSHD